MDKPVRDGPGPLALGGLLSGRRGLVMGIANDHSIAWGIARAAANAGAALALTYQGETFGRRVRPLAETLGAELVLSCDVSEPASLDAVFATVEKAWPCLDFVVHAIAYSDRTELKGRYADTSRENFLKTLEISCYSFTDVARRAAALMSGGGSLLTLTYDGSRRVMPNYNVMGVAKAALEASVRYLASDFGPQGIRVNAISAGTMRTLAGAGIADGRAMFAYQRDNAPLRRAVDLKEVGGAAVYLLSDLGGAVTGEIHHVDCGFHVSSMPTLETLGRLG